MNKHKICFWLDVMLAILLVLTMVSLMGSHHPRAARAAVSQTWGMIHNISGTLLLIGCAAHAFLHWDWIRAVILRRPAQLTRRVRACRLINLWLFGVSVVCSVTGLAAWTMSGFLLDPFVRIFEAWYHLHQVSGVIMFLIMAAHLALHRKWIASNARRCLGIEGGERQSQLEARGELR